MNTFKDNYYIEKTYTFLIQHEMENIVEKALKDLPNVEVVEAQAGSSILILRKVQPQHQ